MVYSVVCFVFVFYFSLNQLVWVCIFFLDMARNKGFIPAGPGEISVQRKQLKAIIESLLPACTEPDIETGLPFRAQAIIANPPAYGESIEVITLLQSYLLLFLFFCWLYLLCRLQQVMPYMTRLGLKVDNERWKMKGL